LYSTNSYKVWFFYFVSSLPAQAARNKLFGNTKRSSQFLYEFVSWIGIKKFHRQKYLSPKKIDSPLCPGMWEHVQLCTKKFYPPSAKVDYTIWLEWHIVNPFPVFVVIFLSRRYADTQYADRCSCLLAIDACLISKIIVFLLSRMSTTILRSNRSWLWRLASGSSQRRRYDDDDHDDNGGNFYDDCRKGGR
jgi:hypothetical protein